MEAASTRCFGPRECASSARRSGPRRPTPSASGGWGRSAASALTTYSSSVAGISSVFSRPTRPTTTARGRIERSIWGALNSEATRRRPSTLARSGVDTSSEASSTSTSRQRPEILVRTEVSDERDARRVFLVARNPQPDTKLPYLVKLPLEGGLVLKAGDTWPKTSRVYCHPFEEDWPEEPNVVEAVPVVFCSRRGAAIDLVLDRPRLARSQFVFTEVKGRPAIFWQTQKTARGANPGGRVPRRRALPRWLHRCGRHQGALPVPSRAGTSGPNEPLSRPGTTPCWRAMASSWLRWSARAWRTWPPPCRMGPWRSSCSALPSSPWRRW